MKRADELLVWTGEVFIPEPSRSNRCWRQARLPYRIPVASPTPSPAPRLAESIPYLYRTTARAKVLRCGSLREFSAL